MGRGDYLAQLDERCSRTAGCAALVGLGGVGKSQLAIEYAHCLRERSPQTWVFWVHAGTQARFAEGYQRIAEMVKMHGWDEPKADVLRLVRSWLCDESNGSWLMIIDNADDSGIFFPSLEAIQASTAANADSSMTPLSDFLPRSSNGSVLVTSRSKDLAFRLVGDFDNILSLEPMGSDDALALLRTKLKVDFNQEAGVALMEALDHLPLALTQAAAYINQRAPRVTVSTYVTKLREGDTDRAILLDMDVGDVRRDGRASNSIIATWQISFEYIRGLRPSATRLLSLMSFFDRQGIPEDLLIDHYESQGDMLDFEEDVAMLSSFSLVSSDVSGSQFEMHRLVQFSTKRWLTLNHELEKWQGKFLNLMADYYPGDERDNWPVCQALFPHAQAVFECRPNDEDSLQAWALTLLKAARYSNSIGNYAVGLELIARATEVSKTTFGIGHRLTWLSMNTLASILISQWRFEEAEVIELQLLEILKTELGDEHPDTLSTMHNLAKVFIPQGRYEEAEVLLERVLKNRQKLLGDHHLDTVHCMDSLPELYWLRGRYNEAEELEARILQIRKELLGDGHPDTLQCKDSIVTALQHQGRHSEIVKLEAQVLQIRKELFGDKHPKTLQSMGYLTAALHGQGRYSEAEKLGVEVLQNRKELFGNENPDTLRSMDELATILSSQGRFSEAEELEVQVVQCNAKVLGNEHPYTLSSMRHLVSILAAQSRYKEAEELLSKAVQGYKRRLGDEHRTTLVSIVELASLCSTLGDPEKGEELMRHAVDAFKRRLGEEHRDTLESMLELAATLGVQGNLREAEELQEHVLQTQKRLFGDEHPRSLHIMYGLANIQSLQGRSEEAEKLHTQVLDVRKKVIGREHPNTLKSMSMVACTRKINGKTKKAYKLMQRCAAKQAGILGPDHPHTKESVESLVAWRLERLQVSPPSEHPNHED